MSYPDLPELRATADDLERNRRALQARHDTERQMIYAHQCGRAHARNKKGTPSIATLSRILFSTPHEREAFVAGAQGERKRLKAPQA